MISQTSVVRPSWEAVQAAVVRHRREDDNARAALHARRHVQKEKLGTEAFALPSIPALTHAPRRIDDEDEQTLRWYFRDPPVAALARSSGAFGNQLEIASAYGYGSLPCRRCGGRWRARMRNGRPSVVDWRDGTGLCPRDHFGKKVSYASALAAYRVRMQREYRIVLSSKPTPRPGLDVTVEQIWQGSVAAFAAQGKRLMTDSEFRSLFDRLPEELCHPCRACQGIGVIPRRAAAHVEITAYPTGSSKHGTTARRKDPQKALADMSDRGVVADGFGLVAMGELERYREVHEVIADMARLSPIAAVSLEEYYGGPTSFATHDRKSGQRALTDMVTELYGLEGAALVRAVSALRDHQCGVYHLAAYGGALAE